MASAGEDGVVRLWNRADPTGVAKRVNGTGSRPAYAVAFSPDGRLLATAQGDGSVKLWDWDAAARRSPGNPAAGLGLPRELVGQTGPIRALAFSSDSGKLAGGSGSDVVVWDTRKYVLESTERGGKIATILEGGRAGQVRALAFSPGVGDKLLTGADKLLVGGDDASIRILDAEANLGLDSLYTGPTGRVQGVAFSPDGKTIAGVGADSAVGLWTVRAAPGDETSGSGSGPAGGSDPDDVIEWTCTHYNPVLPQWPKSISNEFYEPICPEKQEPA